MISLIYKDLLRKYDEILTSTSRGFDTEHEFLESWVPNPEINQSISDLINSAIDYDIKEFELILPEKETKDIDLDNLKKKFSKKIIVNLNENKLTITLI